MAHADTAESAADAARLGGRGPASYLSAARVKSGAAAATSTSQEVILRWPKKGITITTDGEPDSSLTVCARNDAGTAPIRLATATSASSGPGGACADAAGLLAAFAVSRPAEPRALLLSCELNSDASPVLIRCTGIDSL